jgi:putative phosphoribosyl transferase
MRFADRRDAGRRLATALARFKTGQPVVLALPRGGVPVGYEIAAALDAPLDLVLVRKIGAPFQPELAVGAVAEGDPADTMLDRKMIAVFRIPRAYLDETIACETREIQRRRQLYLHGRQAVALQGRTAIVVDDGIATGATMTVALRAVRHRQPATLVMAIPVAPPDSLARLKAEADEIVCLHAAPELAGVGQFYADFRQLEDREVTDLLDRAAARAAAG